MGLTIHYSLSAPGRSLRKARELVTSLRQRALGLPLQHVGDIIELRGDACDFTHRPDDDPNRWLLIQATEYVERGNRSFPVPPVHLVAFDAQPGDGCESANFGLCLYPSGFKIDLVNMRTNLPGWRWRSFCKTQYASNERCGGVPNFLRCHLSLVALLDYAKQLGILADVCDEGDYWQKRDVAALAREVGESNEQIAAFAGQLRDRLGHDLEAPITAFPDYEHLEAKGQRHLPGAAS